MLAEMIARMDANHEKKMARMVLRSFVLPRQSHKQSKVDGGDSSAAAEEKIE
jgi:hypothetical protein